MQLYDMYNTNEFVIILSSYAFECIQIKVKPTASTNVPISYFNLDFSRLCYQSFKPSMGIMEAMSFLGFFCGHINQ